MVEKLQKILVEKFSFLNPEQLDLVGKLRIFLKEMTGAIFDILLNAVSLVTTVIIVPFVTFFLLKEGREIKRAIIEKVPNRYFEMSLNLIHKIDQQISGYLRGIMLDAITVGILSIIGLYILNVTGLASVKYFIVIGALAGFANMVPYLGPIAGMIPAAALSIIDTGSFMSVVWIIVLFLVIQLIDEAVVYPTVVSSGVNLHPLTVIIALIVGGSLFGFIGLLVAVPVTGILKVTFTEIYIAIKKYHLL
jgi:putative permease